jgi:hypothetical protein
MATTWVTPAATGTAVINAALAPAIYNPPKSVSTVVSATSSTTDIGVTTPYLWIASGATLSVPLAARVVNLGSPLVGSTVNFAIMQGSASLSAPSAVTNSSGYASVSLNFTNFSGTVLISACVAPGNNPCQTIAGNSVAANMINLQAVAGLGQVCSSLPFQPMTVRVTDSSMPPNGVLGETVLFQSTVMRPVGNGLTGTSGDPPATPSILIESQIPVASDVNGLATFIPSVGSFTGPLQIAIQVSAGAAATLQGQMETFSSDIVGTSFPIDPWPKPVRAPKIAPWEPRDADRRLEEQ